MSDSTRSAPVGELSNANRDDRAPLAPTVSLARALSRVASARVTSGNDVHLLVDGPDTFSAMHAQIASAKHAIDFEQYYWAPDEVGRGFADALAAAAKRGIRVRIIADWAGARRGTLPLLREVARAGAEVRVFNRPGWRRWLGILPRDHRKVLVTDGKCGVTGGIGIAEVWGAWRPFRRKGPVWRDTAVEIRGPGATDLERAFLTMWRLSAGQRFTRAERRARKMEPGSRLERGREIPALVGIVEGEPGKTRVARALQLAAVAADRSLWIASAYFVPGIREAEALAGAARDGVDVRLLVPNKNDHQWVTSASRRYYRSLLRYGVRIWEWNGPMMHAKMSITDGRVTRIGSTDLNPLGVAINYELDAFIEDATLGKAAEEQFLRDLDGSTEVCLVDGRMLRRTTDNRTEVAVAK
jgi:cardiolipin synthase